MNQETAPAISRIGMSAVVHRVNWANKPRFVPARMWIFLKKHKVPGTYYTEDLGEIASTEDGSLQVEQITR